MTIYQLPNPIAVHVQHGKAKCIAWIEYGSEVNTVWKCRIDESGEIKNYYDTDLLVIENMMNGEPEIKIPDTWKK